MISSLSDEMYSTVKPLLSRSKYRTFKLIEGLSFTLVTVLFRLETHQYLVCVNIVCSAVLDLHWTMVDAEPPTPTTTDTYYLFLGLTRLFFF